MLSTSWVQKEINLPQNTYIMRGYAQSYVKMEREYLFLVIILFKRTTGKVISTNFVNFHNWDVSFSVLQARNCCIDFLYAGLTYSPILRCIT